MSHLYPDKFEEPIFIVGCARSYTSVVAGTINLCGAWGGRMCGPHPTNPKGFFENLGLRAITKTVLNSMGCDPRGQYPLANPWNVPRIDIKDEIFKQLQSEGYQGGIWFYKEPKMAPIWPIFHTSFPKAKWVIVRRSKMDICHSVLKTEFMNHKELQNLAGCKKWVEHHIKCMESMKGFVNWVEIWPEEMDNYPFIKRDRFYYLKGVLSFLGLEWNEEAVKDFVDLPLKKGNL